MIFCTVLSLQSQQKRCCCESRASFHCIIQKKLLYNQFVDGRNPKKMIQHPMSLKQENVHDSAHFYWHRLQLKHTYICDRSYHNDRGFVLCKHTRPLALELCYNHGPPPLLKEGLGSSAARLAANNAGKCRKLEPHHHQICYQGQTLLDCNIIIFCHYDYASGKRQRKLLQTSSSSNRLQQKNLKDYVRTTI